MVCRRYISGLQASVNAGLDGSPCRPMLSFAGCVGHATVGTCSGSKKQIRSYGAWSAYDLMLC